MKKKEKSNQYAILLVLKIIGQNTNAKNLKKKKQLKPINELIKTFPNVHQFCNGVINKFVLLLIIYLGNYHDLYGQSYTLLFADVFENFRNKCIEIYELDPTQFLSALGLT